VRPRVKPRTQSTRPGLLEDPEDFSFVLGGPLFQLLRRAHLADDDLQLARKRVIVISLFVWLPLLLLSVVEGNAVRGRVAVPFLLDIEAHVRFLVAMPLLIGAEILVHTRMRPLVKQFLERQLIPESEMPRFDSAIKAAVRLRNSVPAELLLIVFVYVVGISIIWRQHLALDTVTWYATPTAQGSRLSLAGGWYTYVSLPAFQFLLCRWYFRLVIWVRLLWQVSRIPLRLVPTHPDRVGGLGFLAITAAAFTPFAVAHGALLAGQLASRIFFLQAKLPQFKPEIVAMVAFMACAILGPLLLFAPQLAQAKRVGLREYGTLAGRYVREFNAKWLRGGAPANEPLIGSADIQSLADLANSYEVVQTMRIAPITRQAVLQVVAATLLPVVPLALTMMPLEDLLKKLLGVMF
jgi:hypothetical protein